MLSPPVDFGGWLRENSDRLVPPVNNMCIQQGDDFVVMAVGGPNRRSDYHINQTEEWFHQVKGRMLLKIVDHRGFQDIVIEEGQMFLLPANIPHNPVRFENTVGIVIERKRGAADIDRLRWYCGECDAVVHEEAFHCVDLGTQLAPIIENYASNDFLRTCSACGHKNDQ